MATDPTHQPGPASSEQLTAWHDRYAAELLGYARKRLGPDRAEEAVQETLLAAMQRPPEEALRDPRAWLFGILRHKVVDMIRRSASEERIRQEVADLLAHEPPEFRGGVFAAKPADWGADPERVMERKEFWEAFDHSVERMPLRMRQAFLLREVDGHSTEDVCAALGITPNNLWVLIHRGRLHLRRELTPIWKQED